MPRRRGRWARDSWTQSDDLDYHHSLEEDLGHLVSSLMPYNLEVTESARQRILLFSKELIAWNDRLNLLSRSDAPNVIRKHVAASAGVFLVCQPSDEEPWIDVGTGAGFPGLVLKILRPDLRIHLLDSARKRCLFLENVLRLMELDGVPILPLRVETLIARGELLNSFAVLMARAVASLADTVSGFSALLRPGGRIVTFKGPQWVDELESAVADGILAKYGLEMESATRIPWTAGHILCLRKTSGFRP